MGRHGPLRALEQGFSAGGQRGLPGRSKRGAVALRGAKGLSSPLCGEGAYLRFRSGLFYIVFLVDLKSMKRKQEEHWMAVGFGFASFRMVGMGMDFKALDTQQALISYRQKAHRVILLDWGGTLSPADMGFYDQRDTDKYQLPESTLAVLRALCADANNHVMILSGSAVTRCCMAVR